MKTDFSSMTYLMPRLQSMHLFLLVTLCLGRSKMLLAKNLLWSWHSIWAWDGDGCCERKWRQKAKKIRSLKSKQVLASAQMLAFCHQWWDQCDVELGVNS